VTPAAGHHRRSTVQAIAAAGVLTVPPVVSAQTLNARQPTVVALHHDDPLTGWVLVHDLHQLYRDELDQQVGSVTASTMAKVSDALRIALP
jgi:mRNA-degrading endonuclease toxin of MazEF toxin-antitoxin module